MIRYFIMFCSAVLFAVSGSPEFLGAQVTDAPKHEIQEPDEEITLDTGLDTSAFDREIRPQDDLFKFVNGTWLRTTEIPSDKSNYGSFVRLADLSQMRIRKIVDELSAKQSAAGSVEQKIGDMYSSFMNIERANELGMSPIEERLSGIKGLKTHADVFRALGELQIYGIDSPVGIYIDQNPKDSSKYMIYLRQDGISLPDRSFYLDDAEKFTGARQSLREYVVRLYEIASIEDGEPAAEKILAFETKLAEINMAREELRNPDLTTNKFTRDELATHTPDLDWDAYFGAARLADFTELNVDTTDYFAALDVLIRETPVEDWVQYLQFKMLNKAAPYLSEPFVNAHFEFHFKALAGVEKNRDRWKRAVEATEGVLGEAVGKIYVERHFPAEHKALLNTLVADLISAFGQSVDELEWMTDETKIRAKDKLSKIKVKIGYPDEWRDYAALEVVADDCFGNMTRAAEFEYYRVTSRLNDPVDRVEWGMTPQTVNAYYNGSLNEIVFPASILQPPFYHPDAPAPLNYGGIGAVIGHEISHAFDDQGSKYNGDGNKVNWWSDTDRAAFDALGERLKAQFDSYEALPGQFVKGDRTLGENIGDLSGLAIAYKAMKIADLQTAREDLYGFTEDQLFFVGWSRVWQRKYTDDEMLNRLETDPHSPSQFRANGPVSNIDAFHDAFNLKEGDLLWVPESERIKIW